MKVGDFDSKRRGFTIIEVVLVLAIAGLIFMMVFAVLPSVQRNERDTERKEDITNMLAAIKKYQSNNRGALPTDWSKFKKEYLPDDFADPDGTDYIIDASTCSSGKVCKSGEGLTMDHKLYVITSAACDGPQAISVDNPRRIAILYKLEGGGAYCGNS